jgi:hypothetical protein
MWSLHKAIGGALLGAVGLTLCGLHPAAGAAPSGAVDTASAPQALPWTACPDIPDTECAGLDGFPIAIAQKIALGCPACWTPL